MLFFGKKHFKLFSGVISPLPEGKLFKVMGTETTQAPMAVNTEIIFRDKKVRMGLLQHKCHILCKALSVVRVKGAGRKGSFRAVHSHDPGVTGCGTGFQDKGVPPAAFDIFGQKSLYIPASLLKEGENEIVVFESDGIKGEAIVEFLDYPTLQ
jgi:hypothetical protein